MFKKFFSGLAESKEQKQRARYLQAFEEFADGLAKAGSPVLADTARRVAQAKRDLDTSELVAKAAESLEVDFDQLATNLCDQIREKIAELEELHRKLPALVGSTDQAKLASHLHKWDAGCKVVQTAYAALTRTGAEKLTSELEAVSEGYDTSTKLGQTIEALLLEVRTAERIRNELG